MIKGNFVLKCPKCESTYIHHTSVETYMRCEDSDTGSYVYTDRALNTTTIGGRLPSGNPSPRRQGMVIGFDCECCGEMKLSIMQHKGETFIEWQHDAWAVPEVEGGHA